MVYVDTLRPCRTTRTWKYKKSCHMFADTLEELHILAKLIGLKKQWFQDHTNFPHYDLNESKRNLVLKYGAVAVRDQKLIEFIRDMRDRNYAKNSEETPT